MTITNWVTQAVWEGSSLKVMARGVGQNNTTAEFIQANIASITYRAVEDGTTPIIAAGTALTVADVVFDTLQTTADDAAWTKDSTGYNFKTVFPPSHFPNGGTKIYISITFTDTTSPVAVVSKLGIAVDVREDYTDTPA